MSCCCDPPWSGVYPIPEPCGITHSAIEYDVPCGFSIDYTGIDDSADTDLFPMWDATTDHRKISRWRNDAFSETWYKPDSTLFGHDEWVPATFTFVLQPAVQGDATIDWTLKLVLIPHGSSYTSGLTIATWTKEDWDPFDTRAAASFSLDQDPDDEYFGSSILRNWHIFDSTLTYSDIQNEAIEHKIGIEFHKNGSSWYQTIGDKGSTSGLGSLVTIDPAQSGGSVSDSVSSFFDGTAHGLPATVDVTPECYRATHNNANYKFPCYYELEKWTPGYLDVDVCVSGTSDWEINGFDGSDYGPPADASSGSTRYTFYHFWHSWMNFESGGNIGGTNFKTQMLRSGTWYLLIDKESSDGVEPGTDGTVWAAYAGTWAAGSYNYGDWVTYTGNDNVYVCTNNSGTSGTPGSSSDWTFVGERLEVVENTNNGCTGDCVGTIYTPAGYEIDDAVTFPADEKDEPELDCLDITLVAATP